MKRRFGKDESDWWAQGVPSTVREKCVTEREKDPERKNPEQYITLIDYYSIVAHNWDIFEEDFTFSKDGGKDKKLSWLKDLNKIRNKTHHVEKWPLSKAEVDFVKEHGAKISEALSKSIECDGDFG